MEAEEVIYRVRRNLVHSQVEMYDISRVFFGVGAGLS